MQKVTILCVGKLKERFYIDAAAEYAKRLSRFCKLELIELAEERLPVDPSPAQINAALAREAAALRSRLPASAVRVALCVEGELRSSEALAAWMNRSASQGRATWPSSSEAPSGSTPPSRRKPPCDSPCPP